MVYERDGELVRTYTYLGAKRKARKVLQEDREVIWHKEGEPYVYVSLRATGELDIYEGYTPAIVAEVEHPEEKFTTIDVCYYSTDNLYEAIDFFEGCLDKYREQGYKPIKAGKDAHKFYKELRKNAKGGN